MGSQYEVEVTVGSARDLKNVNWRNGELKPYAVLWVDSGPKVSTHVDLDNGESPSWDEKVLVPLLPASRIQDAVLYLDVVHVNANAADGVKPLVGSARLPLRDVLDDAGVGGKASRSLKLKRPSGRPQGRLEVRVAVREPSRYYDSGAAGGYPAPAGYAGAAGAYGGYGGAAPGGYGGYGGAAPGAYGAGAVGGYGAAYATAAPPAGYPASYGAAPPPQAAYGSAYGAAPPAQPAYVDPAKKKKKGLGVGGGLAVGAAAGVLGGLALAEGASYLEDKVEDEVAERVEEDQYGGDDYGGGGDDYGGDDGDY